MGKDCWQEKKTPPRFSTYYVARLQAVCMEKHFCCLQASSLSSDTEKRENWQDNNTENITLHFNLYTINWKSLEMCSLMKVEMTDAINDHVSEALLGAVNT